MKGDIIIRNRISVIPVSVFLALFFLIGYVNAQNEISPEKKAAIKELVEVTGAAKLAQNIANNTYSMIVAQYQDSVSRELEKNKVTEAQQQKMEAAMSIFFERVQGEFNNINFVELIDQVSYPLYDKYFTEAELSDQVVFYKSSTGKKTIQVMPNLMQESMQETQRLFEAKTPQLQQKIEAISKEELEPLLAELKQDKQANEQGGEAIQK